MELLSDRDVRGLLSFLHEAAEVDGPDAFTEEVVEAFWQLIPADHGASCNTFSGVDPDVAPEARSLLSFSEIDCDWCAHVHDPWTEELDEACRVYIERDDPHPPRPRFINRAVRRSDLVLRAEYCRRGLWADVERLVGAEDQLCLWLEVPGETFLRRMFFLTTRRDGISDRDLRVLELLTPHLIRLSPSRDAKNDAAGAGGADAARARGDHPGRRRPNEPRSGALPLGFHRIPCAPTSSTSSKSSR